MRTKILLSMAALAAGVASSMAQSNVYSLNIVGYVNVPTPVQYSFQTAPLKVTAAVTNGANEILPANTGQFDGDQILIWKGHGWGAVNLDSTSPTGFSDSGGNPTAAPILSSGLGFVYYNAQGVSNNITYVGDVRTGTNLVSIPASPEYSALGSPVPLSGGISTVLGLTNPGGVLDGDQIQILLTRPNGTVQGWRAAAFDSASPTGFSDSGGNPIAEPVIVPGQGFVFDNLNAAPVTWTQIFNP